MRYVPRSVECRPSIHAPPPHHDAILYLTLLVSVNAGQRLTPEVLSDSRSYILAGFIWHT